MVAKPAEVSRSVNVTKRRHAHRDHFDCHSFAGTRNGCFGSRTRIGKGNTMRRMMQSLFVLAVLATSASAQGELTLDAAPGVEAESCNTCTSNQIPQPSMSGCGNSVGSQVAAYMNAYPTHPNLWASYSTERSKRLDCLYRHVNGCNCEDPKRNLHAQPSTICSKSCGACEEKGCEGAVGPLSSAVKVKEASGFAQLHTQPSAVIQNQPAVVVIGKNKSMAPRASVRLPAGPVAKPANAGLTVKPLW